MSTNVRRRLDALEGRGGGAVDAPPLLWIRRTVIGCDEEEPTQARFGDELLIRGQYESEAEFIDRVRTEALKVPLKKPGLLRTVTLE